MSHENWNDRLDKLEKRLGIAEERANRLATASLALVAHLRGLKDVDYSVDPFLEFERLFGGEDTP